MIPLSLLTLKPAQFIQKVSAPYNIAEQDVLIQKSLGQ